MGKTTSSFSDIFRRQTPELFVYLENFQNHSEV